MDNIAYKINDFFSELTIYNHHINQNTLFYLCLSKLIESHNPKKDEFSLEELLDIINSGIITMSYILTTIIATKLKLIHLETVFDSLIYIYFYQLATHVNHKINYLTLHKILGSCYSCNKYFLLPSDYYYYKCEYCANKSYYKTLYGYYDPNVQCIKCNNCVTYYLIIDNYQLKLNHTHDNTLQHHTLFCSQQCIDNYKTSEKIHLINVNGFKFKWPALSDIVKVYNKYKIYLSMS